ncbi:unnamed protein product [Camellia sinensis]
MASAVLLPSRQSPISSMVVAVAPPTSSPFSYLADGGGDGSSAVLSLLSDLADIIDLSYLAIADLPAQEHHDDSLLPNLAHLFDFSFFDLLCIIILLICCVRIHDL